MNKMHHMPKSRELMKPLLRALHDLGGSGSNDEILNRVLEILELPEETLAIPHAPERSNQSEVDYRLAWAKTYLKKVGVVDNSERGIWSIVPAQNDVASIDPQEVVRKVRAMHNAGRDRQFSAENEDESESLEEEYAESWRSQLFQVLTQQMAPDAFERLVKRMLRESGFVQVEVTGHSGDGGIDGKGIIRIGGLLSFHVLFQCKKYQGTVSSGAIRDFRGALVGRADKGLFVTTGAFTREAIKEAQRDGASPIDLMDGEQLADKLKELGLGVTSEMVERISVDGEWFSKI